MDLLGSTLKGSSMKTICVVLIKFYQRFISPYKGFHCAHHVVYGKDTCSNAVKNLILKYGFFKALPFIRVRFDDCRSAYDYLHAGLVQSHNMDLLCDIPCDFDVGDCGGSSSKGSACDCLSFCDWPFSNRRLSNTTKFFLAVGLLLLVLFLFYIYHQR